MKCSCYKEERMKNNTFIVGINITIPKDRFEIAFTNINTGIENNGGDPCDLKIENAGTAFGANVYKVTITNTQDPNTDFVKIIAADDPITHNMCFKEMKLSNLAMDYYDYTLSSQEYSYAIEALAETLLECAKEVKGTFAYIRIDDQYLYKDIIRDGQEINDSHLALYADGVTFAAGSGEPIDVDEDLDDDLNTPVKFQYVLKEWLKDNQDLKDEISKLPKEEQIDAIGTRLIGLRNNDELSIKEFQDYFVQCGIIGYKSNTLKSIYKMFM